MTPQPGAQEFKSGDKVIGKVFLGGTGSGTILEFTEGTEGKFAHLTSGKYLHLESLRPASPPAESRAEMPEMYGTMPDVLPETLPAGTRVRYAIDSSSGIYRDEPGLTALSALRWDESADRGGRARPPRRVRPSS